MTLGVESKNDNVTIPSKDFSKAQSSFVLAPLWFPTAHADTLEVSVRWEQHSAKPDELPSSVLQSAAEALNSYSLFHYEAQIDYNPTWALLVEWIVTLVPEDVEQICELFDNCSSCESMDCVTTGCSNYTMTDTEVLYVMYWCSGQVHADQGFIDRYGQEFFNASYSVI